MLLDMEDAEAFKSFLAYFFVKLSFRRDTIMGKFLRSLYVGKRTEYLFLAAIDADRGDEKKEVELKNNDASATNCGDTIFRYIM